MRILVVSNRLPFSVRIEGGGLLLEGSSGGLVSGLSAYLDAMKVAQPMTAAPGGGTAPYVWVGWPGITIPEEMQASLRTEALDRFHAAPVFVPQETMDRFYNGFCNSTLYPLFLYFPSYVSYDARLWDSYQKVNEIFRDAVLAVARPGDVIWVHDYHLMLLPHLLREKLPDIPIGFFLHIPFPSFELFRLLPREWSRALLTGLYGADLIGFHTNDYAQYFLRSALRLLGDDNYLGRILTKDRMIRVGTYPMGIDFERYFAAVCDAATQEEIRRISAREPPPKIVLSVDRLDYTKGILNRLKAYQQLLKNSPGWRERVVLIALVVPSRIGVAQYDLLKSQIEQTVGAINSEYGTISWTPVIHLYRHLPLAEVAALYQASDVALVTPLRDGMNLVAKEWVASRTRATGTLILSETAGAAKELVEAIQVNPNSIESLTESLERALSMPPEEARRRIESMQARLRRYDVVRWADTFLKDLAAVKTVQARFRERMLGASHKRHLLDAFRAAGRRLILLDYDGTLAPFTIDPQAAKPTPSLFDLLQRLSGTPRSEVVIISGRDRRTLEEWLHALPIGLVAEHGAWMRPAGRDWALAKPLRLDWKPNVLALLTTQVDRLPGSFVEEKEASIVWHYRSCDPEFAALRAQELFDELTQLTANIEVQVLMGNKVIEVRSAGTDKGTATLSILSGARYDFILAIGDDWTDEQMFRVLPKSAFSIRVGMGQSHARFNLVDQGAVIALLEELSAL